VIEAPPPDVEEGAEAEEAPAAPLAEEQAA
jgi:hypothetical protein